MGLLSGIFNIICKRNNVNDKSLYVFYKIVDSVQDGDKYILQCINTRGLFNAALTDIVFDIDILHGLHPIQACYIGIEFSKFLKKSKDHSEVQQNQKEKWNKYSVCRYGNYQICFQDRKGNLNFVNNKTGESFLMDPRDIALSEELIQEFDAAQAFHVGVFAGLKLNNPTAKRHEASSPYYKQPCLRVVK